MRCRTLRAQVLPRAGHAVLSDPSVDVVGLMRGEGFLVDRRTFTSSVKLGQTGQGGPAGPVEVPNKQVRWCAALVCLRAWRCA